MSDSKDLTTAEILALERGERTFKESLKVGLICPHHQRRCRMTKQEYENKINNLDNTYDMDGKVIAINEEYIASLEAEVAKLNRALDVAARKMYNCTGSCPNDVYGWRHPRTCGIRCEELEQPDGWVHCWREYALAEAEKEKP